MTPSEQEIPGRVTEWAAGERAVRAVLLTGSRADPSAPLDVFSDFDILLFVSEGAGLAERSDWVETFGPVLLMLRERVTYRDLVMPTRLVQYRDGSRIDFTLAPVELLRRWADASELPRELERGYQVLLDKEDLARRLATPSGLGYAPERPSEEEFIARVEAFWWETVYVAKNLARGELLAANYNAGCVLRFECLVPMLEWYVQVARDWKQPVGPYGRALAALLPARDRTALEATFAGPGTRENWEALFATIGLYRRAARAVADDLGYRYPEALDRDVGAYLERVRSASRSG